MRCSNMAAEFKNGKEPETLLVSRSQTLSRGMIYKIYVKHCMNTRVVNKRESKGYYCTLVVHRANVQQRVSC